MIYSCNLRTGETTGIFDGASDMHLDMFKDYLTCRQAHIGHPMLLAVMMLEILTHLSIARRNVHQKALFDLEVSLGVTRGRGTQGLVDQRNLSQLEISTPKCNRLVTSLTYFERRLDFAKWALWVHIATTKWMRSASTAQQVIPEQPPDYSLDVNYTLPDLRAHLAEGPIYHFRG
jgi:hypothetical protein